MKELREHELEEEDESDNEAGSDEDGGGHFGLGALKGHLSFIMEMSFLLLMTNGHTLIAD